MDLKCKPIFELPILFEKPISFQLDELMSLKVPLIAVPEPNLVLEKLEKDDEASVEATFKSNPDLDEPVHKGQHFVQPVLVWPRFGLTSLLESQKQSFSTMSIMDRQLLCKKFVK